MRENGGPTDFQVSWQMSLSDTWCVLNSIKSIESFSWTLRLMLGVVRPLIVEISYYVKVDHHKK